MNQRHTANSLKQDVFASLWQLVGNTPMAAVQYRYAGGPVQEILVKCEHDSMTGSIKDRVALYILQKAYHLGTIRPDDTIVEASDGNMGIAFAAVGKALGHPVKLFVPDSISVERLALLGSLGAEIRVVSEAEGGPHGCIRLAEAEVKKGDVFLPSQFEQLYQIKAHERTTGWEIWDQLQLAKKRPLAFVAGVGTGGTITGVSKHLRSVYAGIKIHPVIPQEKEHGIEGIHNQLPDMLICDEAVAVSSGEAVAMAYLLGRKLGLAVGPSSGANFLGAIKIQQASQTNDAVITIFPDSSKKYLSTSLLNQPGEISATIELLDYRVLAQT